MSSTKKAAKVKKAAPAKARGKAGKPAAKSAVSSKTSRAKTAKTSAKTVAPSRATAKKTAARKTAKKSAPKKSLTTKAATSARGSAAKTTSRAVAARKRGASKATAPAKRTVRAAAKSAKTKTPSKKSATLAAAAKNQTIAAPAKISPIDQGMVKNVPPIKVEAALPSKPVAKQQPAPQAPQRPANESKSPTASEAPKVMTNLPETAVKAAPRSLVPPVVAATALSGAESAPAKVAPAAAAAAKPAPQKSRPAPQKHGFKLSEFVVYPAHGVGQIIGVEVQEVAGFSLELFVVSFIKDKMILKVPTSKVAAVGMRKLADADIVEKALSTLSGRARIKRTMWSRRAQEYEAKINSGDLVTIAEVVRDLFRTDAQPEQSYSERQLYEAALDRMAREIAAARKLIDAEALKLIEAFLMKGPRRGKGGDADIVDDPGDDPDVERAA